MGAWALFPPKSFVLLLLGNKQQNSIIYLRLSLYLNCGMFKLWLYVGVRYVSLKCECVKMRKTEFEWEWEVGVGFRFGFSVCTCISANGIITGPLGRNEAVWQLT